MGGQYKRLIGLFKSSFYKSIGNGVLTWSELEEIVFDIEIAMNNRPLCYLEDDVQLPVLTPNTMFHTQPTYVPEIEKHHIEDHQEKHHIEDHQPKPKYVALIDSVICPLFKICCLSSTRIKSHNSK